MIRFLLRRFLVLFLRLFFATAALLALVEISFGVFGGSDLHVWSVDYSQTSLAGFSSVSADDVISLQERLAHSSLVLLLGWGGSVVISYSWGILGARLSKFRLRWLLVLPFSLVACLPGFWFVVVIAIYSFFEWQRPGFANDVFVETGPDLMKWWHAAVLAVPILGAATSWQMRAVAATVEQSTSKPFVGALYLAGLRGEDIFYGNALRNSAGGLIGLLDRTLPFAMGSLICLEWAFRYDGMGSLLVASVKAQFYSGIFASGFWMILVIGVTATLRECLQHWVERD